MMEHPCPFHTQTYSLLAEALSRGRLEFGNNTLSLMPPVMRTSIGPKGSCAPIPYAFSGAHFGESAFYSVG